MYPKELAINEKIKMRKIEKNIELEKLQKELALLNDVAIQDYLGFQKDNQKEAQHIIKNIEKGKNIYYFLYQEQKLIGIFYLYDIKEEYQRANLSLGLIEAKRGHVLSMKMVRTLIEWLFSIGYNRLGLEIEDTNKESLKLAKHLEKIGFQYEGKLRDNYGININSNVWALLKRDYQKEK